MYISHANQNTSPPVWFNMFLNSPIVHVLNVRREKYEEESEEPQIRREIDESRG